MLRLNELEALKKERKRVGRGGDRGGTSGRGHKGQRARSGGKTGLKAFFEGGQMSITRRLPHRGFTNRFRKEFTEVSLASLDRAFENGANVTMDTLREVGLVKKKNDVIVKILSNGSLTKSLNVHVHACTKSAKSAIEESGGSVQLIGE